jgi:hypothetical protein
MDDIREVPKYLVGLWVPIRKVADVIYLLEKGVVNDLSLDHDMGCDQFGELPTGYDLVCWMEREDVWPDGKISVHSANPVGRQKMLAVLEKRR